MVMNCFQVITTVTVLLMTLKTVSGRNGLGRTLSENQDSPAKQKSDNRTIEIINKLVQIAFDGLPSSPMVLVVAYNWSDVPEDLYRQLQKKWHSVYMMDIDHLLMTIGDAGSTACQKPRPIPGKPPLFVVFFLGDETEPVDLRFSWIWNPDAYYIIVTDHFDWNPRQFASAIWQNESIYKTIVLTPSSVKLYNPLDNRLYDSEFANIPLGSLHTIPDLIQSRTSNFQGRPLRMLMNVRMPTVIRGEGNGTFIGIDGSFANVLAKTMNATPVYLTEKYYAKIFYGNKKYNGSNYGTMAAVVDRRAELTANGHFLRDYGCYVGELTRHITNDKVCLLAPKAGVMPPMITVLKSFQYEVWIMMAVTYIVTALIYFAGTTLNTTHTGPTGCNLGLELYRMFIGAPTNRAFAQSGQKMLTLFCLLYTVVILNAFQGSLVTFLSTPMHYPDLNTFKELEKSDVPIRTFSLSFKEILTNDPNLRNLASRVEKWESQVDLKNSDGYHVGFQRVNVFNLGHFKDIFYSGNKTRPRALHTMNECLISYYISYVVHRHSPYKKRINTVLSWIDQAGLVTKWNSDVTKYIFNEYRLVNPKDHEKSKVFTVRDLEVAFIILFFGLVLSFSVFVIELLICKKPIQQSPQHLPFIL